MEKRALPKRLNTLTERPWKIYLQLPLSVLDHLGVNMSPLRGAYTPAPFPSMLAREDPYQYRMGFRHRCASEAISTSLPKARNTPQR